jgi:hypothetical protein
MKGNEIMTEISADVTLDVSEEEVANACQNPYGEIERLKARIRDLETYLKRHRKDWLAYQAGLIEKACPNWANHTPQPNGVREWAEWATESQKTRRQVRCPVCNLYQIWIPRENLDQ